MRPVIVARAVQTSVADSANLASEGAPAQRAQLNDSARSRADISPFKNKLAVADKLPLLAVD